MTEPEDDKVFAAETRVGEARVGEARVGEARVGEARVGVREFRGNLTGYLRAVREGQAIFITSHDTVIAEIHPPSVSMRAPRQPGALRGQIVMAEDFDAFPEDILAAMEG
jgi:antitoxin (DNA-binding transcriptional repressor) of toxin-antitoxin stability system